MKYIPIFIFSLFMGMISCVSEIDSTSTSTTHLDATITLRVATNETRALDGDDENEIDEIDVLVFSKTNSTDPDAGATFFYRAQTVYVPNQGADSSEKNFRVTLRKDTKYQQLAVFANTRSVIEDLLGVNGDGLDGLSKDDVMKLVVMEETGLWDSTTDNFTPLPMWGESTSKVFTDAASAAQEITMTRAQASINVEVATAAQSSFELTGVWLYNASSKGRIAGDANVSGILLPEAGREKLDSPLDYSTLIKDKKTLKGEIYTFEAPASASSTENVNPFLLVEGTWGGDTGFYRIDFYKNSEPNKGYLPLLRNNQYNVTINSVSGRGYSTEAEAIAAGFTNLEATTLSWNAGSMGSIVWDGQTMLAVTQKEYTFYPEAQTVTTLHAATNYSGGWKAETGDDWITLDPATISGAAGTAAQIKFTIEANVTADRVGTITVTAGRLKQEINIIQKVDKELELEIGDVEVVFSASNPQLFSLPIEWEPAATPVTISVAAADGYTGIDFTDNPIPATLADADNNFTNGGSALLEMTPNNISVSSFEERRSVLTVTSVDGDGKTKVKTVLLRQFNYAVAVTGMQTNGVYQLGTTYTLTVRANTQWKVTVSDTNGQITVPVTSGEPDASGTSFTFTTGSQEGAIASLTFSLPEQPSATPQVVNITQASVDPNCYIVYPAAGSNTVKLPLRKAFNVWKNDADLGVDLPTTGWGAELVWQDEMNLIPNHASSIQIVGTDSETAYIEVAVNTDGIEGNAVVAFTIGGEIYWSWHLWVLEADNDPTLTTYTNSRNGVTMMDRNVGAITNYAPTDNNDVRSFGLYYQWGRKDPFPGPKTTVATLWNSKTIYNISNAILDEGQSDLLETSGTGVKRNLVLADVAVKDAIHNPLTLLYSNYGGEASNQLDWYSNVVTKHRVSLWYDINNKTEFDPCPAGWMLAKQSPLEYVKPVDAISYGVDLSMGFYPLTGYRTYTFVTGVAGTTYRGRFSSMGTRALIWGITATDYSTGRMFDVMSAYIAATGAAVKANACVVRCAKIQ